MIITKYIQDKYDKNEKANIGSIIQCPMCDTYFTKIQYSQKFCSIKCKDHYWNIKRHGIKGKPRTPRKSKNKFKKTHKTLYSIVKYAVNKYK